MRPWTKRGKEIARIKELLQDPTNQPYPVADATFPEPPPPMEHVLSFNSTDRKLHQHQQVLDIEPCCDQDVVGVAGEGEGRVGAYSMSKQVWEDMGSPPKVTISVFPGDHLN